MAACEVQRRCAGRIFAVHFAALDSTEELLGTAQVTLLKVISL